jgi:hypothetical protein
MKTTIKTFLFLLLISFSGSVFAQHPCSNITKQINALKINIEKDRKVLAKLEVNLRSNPRNLAKIQPQINKKINEIELQKTRKKKLQDEYEKCLVKNRLANNKEDAKVVASTEKKMAKNANIKKNNAINKGLDEAGMGSGSAPLPKVPLTQSEKIAKSKLKQDAKNDKNDALNESAAVKAWKAEFKTTKTHTLEHTLNTIQLKTEFERLLKKENSLENLYFYQNVKRPPASWNLRVIYNNFLKLDAPNQVNLSGAIGTPLNKAILTSNYVVTPDVISLMEKAQNEIFQLMKRDSYEGRFKQKMDNLAQPPKKSNVSKK